jgi:hypothetical protein
MTNKTVCPHSVLRCTMLVGTAGVLSGVVLSATSAQSQTGAATAGRHGGQADQPAGKPEGANRWTRHISRLAR